ncbi:MAG: mechanosensitive ion channel family protein, partial [Candidatus Krumholzibacteriia bacterium]
MERLDSMLGLRLGPWTLGELGATFAILAASLILRAVIVNVVNRRLRELASRTSSRADDLAAEVLVKPLGLLVLVGGLYLAFRILAGSYPELLKSSSTFFRAATTALACWLAFRLIDAVALAFQEKAARTENRLDDQIVPLLRKAAKVMTAILGFITVVQNLGYSVSGLLAGLGIGGLAFALAAKDTVANLFGSLTIIIDRPFRIGDRVTIDGTDGVVEEIGLRSTRIRTLAKTLVTMPNQGLANATIENHSLMPKRRIQMSVGVTYDATPHLMREAVGRIEAWLRAHPGIDQEFMLVKFTEFGASSLDILVHCFTRSTDWAEHLAVREQLCLGIMDILEELGLEVAFHTRTLHLAGGNGGNGGGPDLGSAAGSAAGARD